MSSCEILDLAKRLFHEVEQNDFPMLRNVIGRAYYSAFHKTQEIAVNKYSWPEKTNIKGGMHEKLYSRLDNHDLTDFEKRKTVAQIKSDLIRLKKKRVNADYYLNISVTKLDADYCIRTAEQVNERLDRI